jgi:hypothetical protein
MPRLAILLALVLPSLGVAAVACGGGGGTNGDNGGGNDSGTSSDTGSPTQGDSGPATDSGTHAGDAGDAGADAKSDGSSDAAADAPVVQEGTQLVSGAGLTVLNVTSDGYVIYWTSPAASMWQVFAVPLAGGAPVTVAGPNTGSFYAYILGEHVLVWQLGGSTDTIGALSVWSHAAGTAQLSTASVAGAAWTSGDDSKLAFLTNATTTTADFTVAGSDGSGATTLTTGVSLTGCSFNALFVSGGIVAQHCSGQISDGGLPTLPPTLTFWPTSGGADAGVNVVDLPANPFGYDWSTDLAGDLLYAVANTTNKGATYALPALTATTIDPTAGGQGFLTSDGSKVFYVNASKNIEVSSTTTPSPSTLVSGGNVFGLTLLSPNGSTLAYYTQPEINPAGDFVSDLYIAPTAAPSSGQAVLTTKTLLAAAVTHDSNYLTVYASTSSDDTTGTLSYVPLGADGGAAEAGAGAGAVLGTNVGEAALGQGARIVFSPNYDETTGVADLQFANLGAGGAPQLLATTIYSFVMSSDLSQAVYSAGVGDAGIYAVSIP